MDGNRKGKKSCYLFAKFLNLGGKHYAVDLTSLARYHILSLLYLICRLLWWISYEGRQRTSQSGQLEVSHNHPGSTRFFSDSLYIRPMSQMTSGLAETHCWSAGFIWKLRRKHHLVLPLPAAGFQSAAGVEACQLLGTTAENLEPGMILEKGVNTRTKITKYKLRDDPDRVFLYRYLQQSSCQRAGHDRIIQSRVGTK